MSRRRPHGTPRFSRLLLSAALHSRDRRFALADLEEEFRERLSLQGHRRAGWWYRGQVLASLLPALRGRLIARGFGERGTEAGALSHLGSDLRIGARMMLRTPLVSVVTVLSLGVGLGAVAVVLSIVDGLLLQPPVGLEEPTEIVSIYRTDPDGSPYGGLSHADFLRVADEVEAFSGVAATSFRSASLASEGGPSSVFMEAVSPNFFTVTGIRPQLGRAFTEADLTRAGDTRVAVLGHNAWQEHFGARERVLGATVRVDGVPFTVVGVAPDGVRSRRVPLEPDVWVPLGSLQPSGSLSSADRLDHDQRALRLLGRLESTATLDMAQAQADVLASRLVVEHPQSWAPEGTGAQSFAVVSEARSRTNPRIRTALFGAGAFFFVVAVMILLLACANVAGLFVARAQRRRGEMALRASLGASRGRIVRMLLAEGIWPGALGGLLGVGIATWATRALGSVALPVEVPIRLDVHITPLVLLMTSGVAVLATLLFSLLPAIGITRTDVASTVREHSTGGRPRFWSVRNGLVVGQCAISALLIVGATLVVRTLAVASVSDLGFDHSGIAVATHRAPPTVSPDEARESLGELRTRLAEVEGVERVAMAAVLELTLFQMLPPLPIHVDGFEPSGDTQELVFHNAVTPGYLEMLSVPMLAGRTLQPSDGAADAPVAVVNRSFADRYWPSLDPIGRTFVAGDREAAVRYRVVGVARDGKYVDFDDPPTPYFYTSLNQDPQSHVAVLLKGGGAAHDHLGVLRREVVPEDGVVQIMPPTLLSDQVSVQFLHLQVLSRLLGWGGFFGLFLAGIGIYGVVAFAAGQRSKEVALRVALGADASTVVRAVAMDGVRLASLGIIIGVGIALPAARVARSLLFGISPTDTAALGVSLTLLFVVAIGASVLPALRVATIDPMATLRSE